ncbi:gamma-glutamyl-gamma-aminobutyrate hydrolase family protein [Sharpea porci]|uniref:gamma-glutamyl-gamma-aminobutyrate hydrolase family protein n=1 Tax=Sharpea porci TaxID=2652286 RepID=UPI002A913189|nr:gamma-glutamyl-gamma-aminobutyrate hydrolase family protein [Sharpea porci]MDY5279490.1 gamma-glutamyl-gamma-aminobutyrate hydrolase family protein [Sharpea porci]
MKPIIGIVALYDEKLHSYWMLPEYTEAINKSGGIPIILPYNVDIEAILPHLDGVLFTGGQDINPLLYGEEVNEKCGPYIEARDYFEMKLMKKVLEQDLPALCICRGLQLLNVIEGGTLYQDLPSQHPSHIQHDMAKPYDVPCHQVTLQQDTPLQKLLHEETIGVNSRHHQAISRLGKHLEAMATSEDGLIEAIAVSNKSFIWGIQWHPEHSFHNDEMSRLIFQEFITNAKTAGQ